jgi:hypothetical protein
LSQNTKREIKEERFLLAYSFSGFYPWSSGFIAFGPVVRQSIIVGAKLLTSLQPGNREKGTAGVPFSPSRSHPQ